MEEPNKKNKQSLMLLLLGAGLLLVAFAAFLAIPKAQATLQTAGLAEEPTEVNFPARDVHLKDLQGRPVAFSDYAGQVIVYNAWATWCPPCTQEMPALEAYYRAHRQDGLVILAVEDGQSQAEVMNYVNSNGLTFPVWPDPKWVATNTYGISDLPTSYVIDRGFNVRLLWLGPVSLEKLEQYVTPFLKKGQD